MSARVCPALLLTAPASGQGKTTVTAALARYHWRAGRRVWVFKAGPDFLDPMILEQASGHPVYTLDLWMVGEERCRYLLYQAAAKANVILIEGMMGLFDGTPSSADLAQTLGVPVLAVIDASSMAQTFAAIALGLTSYCPELPFVGVLANRVAGPRHGELLAEGLSSAIPYWGGLMWVQEMTLPQRHLGLVQAEELSDLNARLETAAHAVAAGGITRLPEAIIFPPASVAAPLRALEGVVIGVARDAAFSFLYPDNLDLLRAMGAELVFFSPLVDKTLPTVDAIYLPGGYPELHLTCLSANEGMHRALHDHHRAGRPLYAECGGMLYLLQSLADKEGHRAPMAGLLPGEAVMQARLVGLGMQSALLPEGTLRGHTFHYSSIKTPLAPWTHGQHQRDGAPGEAVYRLGRLTATYLHLYFPSNPQAVASLFHP
jgi:cobyrinic acid a,c-diamide synthase